jgi:hypothetical protein
MNGFSYKINQDPTATVDKPWNNVVVSFTTAGVGTIPVTTVRDAFLAQLTNGSATISGNLEFQFRELRAWELAGNNVGAVINDLTTGEPHHTMHDEPGRNHWAAVGLKWANSQQLITRSSNSTQVVATVSSSGVQNATILVHVQIRWRFAGGPAPTSHVSFKA